jgi:hypothetical protein
MKMSAGMICRLRCNPNRPLGHYRWKTRYAADIIEDAPASRAAGVCLMRRCGIVRGDAGPPPLIAP